MIRWKVLNEYKRSCYARGEFSLIYEKGTIVNAKAGTLGIMVFKTKTEAKLFKKGRGFRTFHIIKVNSIGRGKVPSSISHHILETSIRSFYKASSVENSSDPPKGTICYKSVEVLE